MCTWNTTCSRRCPHSSADGTGAECNNTFAKNIYLLQKCNAKSNIAKKSKLTFYQFGRGHAIRFDDALQINKQLHGQRTYFLPGGAARIGWERVKMKTFVFLLLHDLTVASLHWGHFTTCWPNFPSIFMEDWQTRQTTVNPPEVPLVSRKAGASLVSPTV